jgi:Tol biopolymer transport system component
MRTVLYGALWDGDVCRIYSVRPESPESAPLPLPPAAPLAVSASGELALALGTHYRGIMTYGTLARVPLSGGAPRELLEHVKYADWSPDGRDLAIVRRVGDRDQLEFPAGRMLTEPDPPNSGFSFPRVSSRGDAVAVFELSAPNNLFGRVVIVDRSGVKRAVSDSYFNVFGLAWRGDEVWFTAAGTLPLFRNTIYAMTSSGAVRVVARVPGNTSLHDIAPDGRMLIARTDDRSGIAVRAPGEASERDLSWLDASNLVDISPDGQRILFSESGVGGGAGGSTYLRGTDGSLAVRLGDGYARALSHDGQWAIVYPGGGSPHLDVIPTGPGQALRLERPGLQLLGARWLADGRHVVVRARSGNGAPRLYVLDIDGTMTRPVTPEGVAVGATGWSVSPDGDMVAMSTGERLQLFPLSGDEPRQVPGNPDRSSVVGWIDSGLLVSDDPAAGGAVFRVDPATGRRDLWAEIQPQDPAGIMNLNLGTFVVTPDGQGYGYTWHRAMSDLFLVEGME